MSTPDLADLAASTIGHYERHAERYRDGTLDHDVLQNVDALLNAIEGAPPYDLLDFGCGPGRDLKTFAARGHRAIGLDGSARFCAMARDYSGCAVWEQDFLALDLPPARFDGVFANATLFHVPSPSLPRVLDALHATLRPRGVLFCSNPRGDNREGYNGLRWGVYLDLEHWRGYMRAARFEELDHYYRPPGLPRAEQPWLATVWRRREA
ncbi:MAG: class I SAM-dependent methyltransferase [Gammaproteobacteria bacterium]